MTAPAEMCLVPFSFFYQDINVAVIKKCVFPRQQLKHVPEYKTLWPSFIECEECRENYYIPKYYLNPPHGPLEFFSVKYEEVATNTPTWGVSTYHGRECTRQNKKWTTDCRPQEKNKRGRSSR